MAGQAHRPDVVDLAKKFEDYGVEGVIYTDIGRDGMLSGVNIEATVKLARALRIPVIASGGIATVTDVEALCAVEAKASPAPSPAGRSTKAPSISPGAGPADELNRDDRFMLAKRIIPCLDVSAGRVVRGVNFVELRDAGDPVEVARRYDEQGADEITFLDITASSDDRNIILHVVEQVAEQVFIPLTVGGGVRCVDDVRRCSTPVPTRSASTPPRSTTRSWWPMPPARSAASASWSPSTPSRSPRQSGRSSPTAGATAPASTPSNGRRRSSPLGAGEILLTSMDRTAPRTASTSASPARSDAIIDPGDRQRRVGNLDHLADGVVPRPRRRGAGGEHLPFRRAHRARSEGADARPRDRGAPVSRRLVDELAWDEDGLIRPSPRTPTPATC